MPYEASWLWSRTHPRWPRWLLTCPRPELQGACRRVARLPLLLKLSLISYLREFCLGSKLPFFFFLSRLCSLQEVSSPARDGTWALSTES